MQSRFIWHRGQEIFYVDYSHLNLKDLAVEMAAVEALTIKRPESSIRAIVDVRGIIVTPAALNLIKASASKTKKYIRKIAVIGVTGVRSTLLDIVIAATGQKDIAPAADEMAAKEYLVR